MKLIDHSFVLILAAILVFCADLSYADETVEKQQTNESKESGELKIPEIGSELYDLVKSECEEMNSDLSGDACYLVAKIYARSSERAKAYEFYHKGCLEYKNAKSCFQTGEYQYYEKVDLDEAASFYLKSCNYKSKVGCEMYFMTLIESRCGHLDCIQFPGGKGFAKEIYHSVSMGCALGSAELCEMVKVLDQIIWPSN